MVQHIWSGLFQSLQCYGLWVSNFISMGTSQVLVKWWQEWVCFYGFHFTSGLWTSWQHQKLQWLYSIYMWLAGWVTGRIRFGLMDSPSFFRMGTASHLVHPFSFTVWYLFYFGNVFEQPYWKKTLIFFLATKMAILILLHPKNLKK